MGFVRQAGQSKFLDYTGGPTRLQVMTRSRFIESLLQDLRIGARVLVKEKGFCALAVASVTIGICAVTTIFAIVNGALLRGLSFPQAGQLVDVRLDDPTSIVPRGYVTTMADFADLKAAQTTCAAFVAYDEDTFNISTKSYAQRQVGTYISHDFFRALGIAPALGRDFLPEDDRPGAAPAVILSDSLWRSEYAGDPQVIGQALRINGGAGTIVGVMPPGLNFPGKSQLWVPINTQYAPRPRGDPDAELIKIIARLKPGVSIEQAGAETAALARRLAAQYPENKSSRGAVQPLARALVSSWLTHLIWSMLAFSVGVLLIACGNVMNMQFARATLRAKELAIRSSLGATRVRLVRQMLTESLLLAVIGSALGVALAYWATARLDGVFHSFRYSVDSTITFAIDPRVLVIAVGLTALATLLSGLLPALVASRPNVMVLLKESGRGSTGRLVNRVTRTLVVGQIAASCVLLIGSLIKAQSIIRGQNVAYGYDTGSILSGNMNLMEGDYPTNESRVFFYEKLLRQLRATPAIKSAALTSRFQMVFAGWGERIEIDSRPYQNDADRPVTQLERISDGYWAITGQRLVEGRDFSPEDNDVREPVAIVNETFAKKHFGRDSPVGHRFRMVRNNGQQADRWRTIVGVVSDVLMLVPANVKNDNAGFYLPFNAMIFASGSPVIAAPSWATVIVTLLGGVRPESYEASLRQAVARVDPNLPLYYIGTPRTNLAIAFSMDRVIAQLFTIFSGIAMLLTAVGFYGMAAYSVNQRTQEFGIRLALGADRRSLIGLVLREGAWQLGLGLALGLATALLFSFVAEDWIASLVLIHIGPRDPPTYLAVVLMFVMVSLAATIVPAWRAARVDPMVALRAE